jgi:hypothetical protein
MNVWLAAKTLQYPDLGGHLWAYLNWALGLKSVGCKVTWLESVDAKAPVTVVRDWIATLRARLRPHGLDSSLALCAWTAEPLTPELAQECIGLESAPDADLLLNLQYGVHPEVVSRFRRTALVDIDPGQLQIWLSEGQMSVAPHDAYFTIGEGVGRPGAVFPDCGVEWHYTPPPVFLSAWPVTPAMQDNAYTTVSNWWSGWMSYRGEVHNNDKRTSFLEYLDLPRHVPAPLELALCTSENDADEMRRLEHAGWRIRHTRDVTSTPEQYRAYVQASRGEFSCAKPACMRLQNGWISDRTLCYLASGKPAIVQHTGSSRFLPDADGIFRFRNFDEAVGGLAAAERDYPHHCRKARALAEEYFDATKIARNVLEVALA